MNQTTPRVMLLIDADNVTADVIEQALQQVMARHGAIHVRRAYCTAELALKQLKLFKTHSIRPIVNVSTGKNSTDIALAVDAMDLVVAERPDLVVIVSSDSDFAPLVIRLREKGCRVEGIGQEGKTGDDSKPVYDAFIDLPHRKAKAAPLKTATARRSGRSAVPAAPTVLAEIEAAAPRAATGRGRVRPAAPAPRAAAMPVLEEWPELAGEAEPAPDPAPPPPRPARKRASRGTAATAAPATASAPAPAPLPSPAVVSRAPAPPALPSEVQRILAALPELQQGGRMQLNLAKERLDQAGLLARNASSTKFFRKHPGLFELTPDKNPNKVQYLGPGAA